jgi:hypothetical protein
MEIVRLIKGSVTEFVKGRRQESVDDEDMGVEQVWVLWSPQSCLPVSPGWCQ